MKVSLKEKIKNFFNNEFNVLKIMISLEIITSFIFGFSVCMLFVDGFYLTTLEIALGSLICVVLGCWGIYEMIKYIKLFMCVSDDEDYDSDDENCESFVLR